MGFIGFLIFIAVLYYLFSDKNDNNNQIEINCPNCRKTLYINEEGNWDCSYCRHRFVYFKHGVYSQDEVHSITAAYIMAVVAKFCKLDGVVSEKELRIVETNIEEFIQPTLNEMTGLKRIFNKELKNADDFGQTVFTLAKILDNQGKLKNAVGLFLYELFLNIYNSNNKSSPEQHEAIESLLFYFHLDDQSDEQAGYDNNQNYQYHEQDLD